MLDQKGKKKSRQNDASPHRPLPWPAVLPGLAFFSFFSFCHPELVEGFGKPLLSSCIGAVASWTATVTSFISAVAGCAVAVSKCISAVRDCTVAVSKCISAVRHYTATVTSFIGAVASCTVAVTSFIGAAAVYTNKVSM